MRAWPGLPGILYICPLFVGLRQRKYLVDNMWHYYFLQFCALDSVLRPSAIFIILKVSTSQTLNWFSILRKTLGLRCLKQIKTLLYWSHKSSYGVSLWWIGSMVPRKICFVLGWKFLFLSQLLQFTFVEYFTTVFELSDKHHCDHKCFILSIIFQFRK